VAALGVLRAAGDAGLAVPGDLSILGFDDIVEASYVGAALTTIRQPLREMGRVAVDRLMSLLADPTQPATRTVMPTELVIRGTTGPPPGGRTPAGQRTPAGRDVVRSLS
jgi:LacI family transcriptional regulator